jgi:acyl-CoA thioester hydrolase
MTGAVVRSGSLVVVATVSRVSVTELPRAASRAGSPRRRAGPARALADISPSLALVHLGDVASAALSHEKRIEIRWRDVDAYQHVNNAVYATYLEECRDEWLATTLGDAGDSWDFVLARVAIDFRRELRLEDDAVVVSCRLERIGTSSLTLREEIRFADGALAAESEAVLVRRDRETGGSRPLADAERAALERALTTTAA